MVFSVQSRWVGRAWRWRRLCRVRGPPMAAALSLSSHDAPLLPPRVSPNPTPPCQGPAGAIWCPWGLVSTVCHLLVSSTELTTAVLVDIPREQSKGRFSRLPTPPTHGLPSPCSGSSSHCGPHAGHIVPRLFFFPSWQITLSAGLYQAGETWYTEPDESMLRPDAFVLGAICESLER